MVKILIADIETSPILAWAYDRWQTNLLKIEKEPVVMSISWKWYGEKRVYHENISQQTEKEMLEKFRDVLNEADIVVGHNWRKFDARKLVAGFIQNEVAPPSPYKIVDTYLAAKRYGMFSSNKLTELGKMFGIGEKTSVTYATLWHDALINNDAKAWLKMRKYNNQDVILTEKLYERLRPYITNHPNIAVYEGLENGCPICGSTKLERRGFRRTNVSTFQKFRCQNCGAWPSARIAEKTVKPEHVAYV